jgi:hypothetical protein
MEEGTPTNEHKHGHIHGNQHYQMGEEQQQKPGTFLRKILLYFCLGFLKRIPF